MQCVCCSLRPRLHEQIKYTLFAQIRPELLNRDREFEQLKAVLFAHVNAALTMISVPEFRLDCERKIMVR